VLTVSHTIPHFMYLFNIYLLRYKHIHDTVLDTWDTGTEKKKKELTFKLGRYIIKGK
jgi:hypothetical protein